MAEFKVFRFYIPLSIMITWALGSFYFIHKELYWSCLWSLIACSIASFIIGVMGEDLEDSRKKEKNKNV